MTDTDGNNTFYPRRFGPDELRECLLSFFFHSCSPVAIANQNRYIAPSRGEGHEDDRPPRDRQSSRGSYADEYDGRDWEWDFPEPQPHRSRRRNTYANDDDRGDEYEDDPAPPPPRGRRRHSYANEFDLDDGYEDDLEPSSHGSRRRHSYMSGYDRGNRYWGSPERPRYGDPSRGTYARDYDHGSSYASSSNGRVRDWGDFEPARTCSYAFNRQGSNSYRDAPVPPWATNHPSWANHPSQRRRLGARPGSSTICGLVRSFLNYTMT